MPEVPPPMRVASSTVTAAPACASRYATEAPITPAPITIVFIICISGDSGWTIACDLSGPGQRTSEPERREGRDLDEHARIHPYHQPPARGGDRIRHRAASRC